ncbi:MAG: pyridoxal phosphate-dependent aminotransferase [Candidatus Muiribacteriaceae bacterium]
MNSNVLKTEQAPLLKVKKKAQGRKGLIDLSQAVPGYSMPQELADHLKDVISLHRENRVAFYTPDPGIPELREKISEDECVRTGRVCKAHDILVTAGANQAVYITVSTLFEPGSKVAVFSPYYFNHCMTLDMTGLEKIIIPPLPGTVRPDIEKLMKLHDVDGVLIVNPSNPTGYCMSREELEQIFEFAAKRDIILISDETYQEFDKDFIPLRGISDHKNIISVKSFSKTYSMTGFRTGYIHACSNIIEELLKVQDCNLICAPHISQLAALYCLKDLDMEWLSSKKLILENNRDLITHMLKHDRRYKILESGLFFAYLETDGDSMDITDRLIEKGVLVAPGEVFEGGRSRNIRVSTGNVSADILEKAISRLTDEK